MPEKPLIYLVLGAPGSGRREIVRDLVQHGLEKEARALVLISDREKELPGSTVPAADNISIGSWTWEESGLNLELPPEFTHVFLVSDGNSNPVDQVEAFSEWLTGQEIELGRIITVVHARLAQEHKELLRWYEACIHFSDIVLINRREEVPQKWLNDFIDYFKKEHHYPCHIEQVKGAKVKNPALVLQPEPRRISLIFDELPLIDDEAEEEDLGEGEGGDPYLERLPSGRRTKQIPDIRKYLD